MNRVQRGEKILSALESKEVLTPGGAAFLKVALDPFHDTPIEGCRGWPDRETSPSIVRCVKRSVEITRPAGFTEPVWSFQVNALPWTEPVPFEQRTLRGNLVSSTAPANTMFHGGVEVTCIDGAPSNLNQFTPELEPQYRAQMGNTFSKGLSRLIGLGFEVSDNTAELYKQGHSYHSRIALHAEKTSSFNFPASAASTTQVSTESVLLMRNPPTTPATAMLYPDTVDWPAQEGCYSVSSFSDDNPPAFVDFRLPVFVALDEIPGSFSSSSWDRFDLSYVPDAQSGLLDTGDILHPRLDGSSPTLIAVAPSLKISNVDLSTSMFTGLNPQASMTLTVHFYVETFPSITETDILVLAQRSCEYDPVALQMYTHAVQHLPVSTRVGNNPDGEWWSNVISAATGFLAPMASAMGFPAASPVIMSSGNLLAQYMRREFDREARRRLEQQKKNPVSKSTNGNQTVARNRKNNPPPKTLSRSQKKAGRGRK